MNCEPARDLLERYLDNELDDQERTDAAAHIAECPECGASLDRLRELSKAVRNPDLYYRAPAYLEARVRAGLREASVTRPAAPSMFIRGMALAAGLALAAVLAWKLLPATGRESDRQAIAQDVVASHIRSMQANHLLDVPSTDQHTVKPWFDGRLDFSPTVKDPGQGFRLLGGRIDYFGGRPVAALVFQRRLHTINVFVWPSREDQEIGILPGRNGYNIVRWTAGGMAYWAIADIPAAELEAFARLYTK